MESENIEAAGHLAPLKKVTPLSKYLAMALFITMPFIGGYIGYMWAPEKVVEREIEKEITQEQTIEFLNDAGYHRVRDSDNKDIKGVRYL